MQRQGPGLLAPQGREALHNGLGLDSSFRLRSGGALHKRSTTISARTVDAVVGGAMAVAASGEKEKIVGGRQRVSLDTAQPCKNVRAAGEQLSRSPSCHCNWPRARGAFCVAGVVMADGKVVLRVWK